MPDNDDAIAALEKAAREAGLEIRISAFGKIGDLCRIQLKDKDDKAIPRFSATVNSYDAAHALIAWWLRRGWVECPGCKGRGYNYARTYLGKPSDEFGDGTIPFDYKALCEKCQGEKRVPPDG